ncbi:tRNA-splicing ligase RtcB [Variovorax sp. SG517]|uniref:RtcB family protein n=1 Tax=Variovorax sp. SG517 TaxID=2587117 RepID=UPI00159E1716|nr:RtcB family protein [Variovorax sp. SG517]NVM91791.1 tRNA-splicing ligase RtcB [Variovorax sp. SG517]
MSDLRFSRLQRAFSRAGIAVDYRDGIYHLHHEASQATVLLPPSLPLEEKAVNQLLAFASVRSPDGEKGVCKACATPDFHPGSVAPVGSVVATDPDFVIPAAVGTDINCGMRLLTTGLTLDQVAPHKTRLVERLTRSLLDNGRDVPVHTTAFKALFDVGPSAFLEAVRNGGLWSYCDRDRLQAELDACIGLATFGGSARHAPEAYTGVRHEVFRDPCLGTPGSGNHFVELQVVDHVMDRHEAYRAGLKSGDVVVMIHSGSRDIGFHVGGRWMDRARDEWPKGLRHPKSGLYGLAGPLADEYLEAMGVAARYAWANRVVLAELVRKDFAELLGATSSRLVVDVPHNVVLREHGMNIHRKGATPANAGDLALIPGSMGDYSYLASGLGHEDWLWSCSHGAGRRMRRQQVRAMRPAPADHQASWQCVTLREERRIEEAPQAYKPIGEVIDAQERAGLIHCAVRLRPWITFKA